MGFPGPLSIHPTGVLRSAIGEIRFRKSLPAPPTTVFHCRKESKSDKFRRYNQSMSDLAALRIVDGLQRSLGLGGGYADRRQEQPGDPGLEIRLVAARRHHLITDGAICARNASRERRDLTVSSTGPKYPLSAEAPLGCNLHPGVLNRGSKYLFHTCGNAKIGVYTYPDGASIGSFPGRDHTPPAEMEAGRTRCL